MAFDQLANQDFERAVSKGFWRKILAWLKRESNDLLPFDEVREKIQIQGQHYIGMREVPIDHIIGSVGRYQEFNRIFLPTQRRTKDRWVNIDKAHYEQIPLPPVDLYKIGEIFFVKDGNHRVSVARERGQEYVDAYVTEIEIPVLLTTDTSIDDLDLKKENADFIIQTGLDKLRSSAHIEATMPGLYDRLLEHIDVHRWYLGENREEEVPYPEAVTSWYDNVYTPVINMIREYDLLDTFPKSSETDLYLWILEYAGYVRQVYQSDDAVSKKKYNDAEKQLVNTYPFSPVKKLIQVANRNHWLDELILCQERAVFLEKTLIQELRPDSDIEVTLPGRYDQILEHIAVHRWYLGEQRQGEVPYEESVTSWYDHVYLPIVNIIREQQVMVEFPNRKETDLFLWIVKHQSTLQVTYGSDIPIEKAVEQITGKKGRTLDKKKNK
jgi:hypothetical protein